MISILITIGLSTSLVGLVVATLFAPRAQNEIRKNWGSEDYVVNTLSTAHRNVVTKPKTKFFNALYSVIKFVVNFVSGIATAIANAIGIVNKAAQAALGLLMLIGASIFMLWVVSVILSFLSAIGRLLF